jgi:hypothetical protein
VVTVVTVAAIVEIVTVAAVIVVVVTVVVAVVVTVSSRNIMYTVLPTNEKEILLMMKDKSHVIASTRLKIKNEIKVKCV